MHKNRYWILLLTLAFMVMLWFTFNATRDLLRYTKLTSKATSDTIEWAVFEKAGDKYYIEARFTFTDNGQKREGTTVFNDMYRNRKSAQAAADKIKDQSLTVWYSQGLNGFATLNKKFPLKQCLYAFIVWGIMIYFILLGLYMEKKHGNSHT